VIVREIKQHEYPDADFEGERENIFFLSTGQEVRLHCRHNRTQRRTYISEMDYRKLPVRQQATFQTNTLNPNYFYCADADAVLHAPAAPAATAAKKPTAQKLAASPSKPSRRRKASKNGGGRGFNWDSDLGGFIVDELSNLEGYRIVETKHCLKVVDEATGLYLDQHQLRTLRSKLGLDRGVAPSRVRQSSNIRILRGRPVEPLVKWVGGKRKLLPQLDALLPETLADDNDGRLVEPFAGGLAVFFHIQPREAILADGNAELINFYEQVRSNPGDLMLLLDLMAKLPYTPEVYYEQRSSAPRTPLLRAARFLYLNRYGFNGLYRVNARGEFNVAFGRTPDGRRPALYAQENFLAASALLQRAELRHSPFERTLQRVRAQDFSYLDPPYEPISATASFTGYTKSGFSLGDQRRVRDAMLRIHRRTEGEAALMLSNSNAPKLVDLYATRPELTIHEVQAGRAVAAKGSSRGRVSEVVITNYAVGGGLAA
jgi:DNA adenine methylase